MAELRARERANPPTLPCRRSDPCLPLVGAAARYLAQRRGMDPSPRIRRLPPERRRALSGLGTGELVERARAASRAIYGTDDRMEAAEVADPLLQQDMDSVCALIPQAAFHWSHDFQYRYFDNLTLASGYGVCPDERFAGQLVPAFCSGVLIGPDLVLTAGHCVTEIEPSNARVPPGSTAVVFGFQEPLFTLPASYGTFAGRKAIPVADYYFPIEYVRVEFQHETWLETFDDYAILRLDRPVTGRHIAPLRPASRGPGPAEGGSVHVAGHPLGLPKKFVPPKPVLVSDQAMQVFTYRLDLFGGNSGSPVFNSATHEVEGIHVGGQGNFVYDEGAGCNRYLVLSESDPNNWAIATSTALFRRHVPGYEDEPAPLPPPPPPPRSFGRVLRAPDGRLLRMPGVVGRPLTAASDIPPILLGVAPPDGWNLVLADDFPASSALDTTKWRIRYSGAAANGAYTWDPAGVFVAAGGGLTLRAWNSRSVLVREDGADRMLREDGTGLLLREDTTAGWRAGGVQQGSAAVGGLQGHQDIQIDVVARAPQGQGVGAYGALLPASGAWPPEFTLFETPGKDKTQVRANWRWATNSQAPVSFARDVSEDRRYTARRTGGVWRLWIDGAEQAVPAEWALNPSPEALVPVLAAFVAASTDAWFGGTPDITTPNPWEATIVSVRVYAPGAPTPGVDPNPNADTVAGEYPAGPTTITQSGPAGPLVRGDLNAAAYFDEAAGLGNEGLAALTGTTAGTFQTTTGG